MNNPYILTICSGKGGVGKTLLSSNIAIQLNKLNQKTLLIDLDLNFPNIHIILGIDVLYRLDDWFCNNIDLSQIIKKIDDNLYFIAGTLNINDELHNNFSFIDLFHQIIRDFDFDFVIIDTSAGVNNCLIEAADISDKIGLVLTDEPTSILDGYGLIKYLGTYLDIRKINAIVNNVIDIEDAEEVITKLNKATRHFLHSSVDLLGIILYDNEVKQSIIHQRAINNEEIVKSFKDIARKLIDIKEKS
jgi:flagellar biosynthesis protein FlhG